MKTKILSIVLFCIVWQETTHAQTVLTDPNTTLKYDFYPGGTKPADFYIKKGAKVHFIIENINKSQYTITVGNTDKSLYTDQPAILGQLTNVDISKLTTAAAQIGGTTGAAGAALVNPVIAFKPNEVSTELSNAKSAYETARTKLSGDVERYMNYYNLLKKLNDHYQLLTDLLTNNCSKFVDINDQKITSTFNELTADFGYAGAKTDMALSAELKTQASGTFDKLDSYYTTISKEQDNLKVLKAKYDELSTAEPTKQKAAAAINVKTQVAATKTTQDVANNQATEAAYDAILQEALDNLKTAKAKVDALNTASFTTQLKKSFDLINYSNFTYESAPFRAAKDLMDININIQSKAVTICDNSAAFNTDIIGKVYGFKVDFSSGLFLLAGKNLFDQTYSTLPINGDANNNQVVQNKNKSTVAPAVGALLHFYYKQPGFFSWGGAFGLSVNNDTNLNYHGGLSALFGEDSRIVLSGGLTLARIKLLTDDYTVGGTIPKTVTTVPTSNFYKWGWFFSLTYNISH